ncbi:membrane steroid-binding protein 2-like [Corylus avellana]|uniref:membrane steroid-binding protein 2-like n=1 Tax=Corylus avellana TaxID=13451 RepID=UPI00286CC607|nr:membrane steroid-binding protein 2-like [Corylus avellana]
MAVELWETLKEAIAVYTGLSPATFFTVLALFLAVYYVISGLFGSSDQYQRPREVQEESQPLPPPVQVGEVTEEELKQYDGSDPQKPLLMAIKGQIYDVSQSRYYVRIFLLSFWVGRICGFFWGFLVFFRGKC